MAMQRGIVRSHALLVLLHPDMSVHMQSAWPTEVYWVSRRARRFLLFVYKICVS